MNSQTYNGHGANLDGANPVGAIGIPIAEDEPVQVAEVEYPMGTKAYVFNGGYWIRGQRGWKWFSEDVDAGSAAVREPLAAKIRDANIEGPTSREPTSREPSSLPTMNSTRSNESRRPHGRPQRSPRHLPSGTRGRNFSAWNRLNDISCLLAVGVAVFGLLVGAAVLDRDQRLQLREVIQ